MTRYSAARLRAARLACGLTIDDASARANVYASTISLAERGQIVPRAKYLDRLASVYDCESLYDKGDPADPVVIFEAGMSALIESAPPFSEAKRAELRTLLYG